MITFAIVTGSCGAAASTAPNASNPIAVASPPASAAPATLAPSTAPSEVTMPSGPFTLTSPAFAEGGAIPPEYTCQGADASPQLQWSGVQEGATALVLVVDDPDARSFTHWLVLDLDPASGGLPKGVPASADPPQQGRNDFGRTGWGGPCPPSGTHHYRFTLSALAAPLGLSGHPDRAAVNAALAKARVLGTVVLTGTYRKS